VNEVETKVALGSPEVKDAAGLVACLACRGTVPWRSSTSRGWNRVPGSSRFCRAAPQPICWLLSPPTGLQTFAGKWTNRIVRNCWSVWIPIHGLPFSVPSTYTVEQTLDHIRHVESSRETVYAIYVLDPVTKNLVAPHLQTGISSRFTLSPKCRLIAEVPFRLFA
jgi:hypothetical protein